MTFFVQTYDSNVRLLKAKATRQSIVGVVIASGAIVVATVLSSYFQHGGISLLGLLTAQKENFVLWFLDLSPFVFAIWGQYVGMIIAYEAGGMVMEQTEELRNQTAALEIKARHDMTHDSLTGLSNRILLQDRFEQAISIAQRNHEKMALLMLDIDRFKEINDTLGHYNGDRLLKQLAVRLKGVIRGSDTLARFGGDEFAILLQRISSEADIKRVASAVRSALEHPFALEGLTLDVQASIGAAIFPDHGTDVDTIMQRTDMAMYAAKHDNHGFVLYSDKIDTSSPKRLTLMGELKRAITHDELELYYQPKVDNQTNQVTGVEALVRWQHPEHGLMMPDEFIPWPSGPAWSNSFPWVLNNALKESLEWRQHQINISVSVNLSAQDLLDPELPDVIAGLLAQYDVPAEQLILEITETSIMADPEMALQVLSRLSVMGVRTSIDDFGTGYSSLAYLKKLPVSEIKIDRSFVSDMLTNPNDEVIVQATIGLAQNLGLDVVAEGVENNETLEKLRVLACNLLQGFLFTEPLSGRDFVAWYQEKNERDGG